MKRENLQRAIDIDKMISEHENNINLLSYNSVNVKVDYYNKNRILKLYPRDDSAIGKLTSSFIEALKVHYETEINELKKELETL